MKVKLSGHAQHRYLTAHREYPLKKIGRNDTLWIHDDADDPILILVGPCGTCVHLDDCNLWWEIVKNVW